MEQANPTPSEEGGASTLDRIEQFLSGDTTETPQNQSDDAVETSDEQEKPQQTEPDKADNADESEQESETPNEYQLSDVAKLLGADESALDVDDDGNVLVKTKVDGVEGKAKFADLLKSYQLQAHVDNQVREAAEQRKALQEQSQAMQQQMQLQQAVIDKIAEVKSLEANLAQYNGIDWNALIDSDPVQAVKLDRQYRDLQQQHSVKLQEVEQTRNSVHQQQQQQQAAMLQSEHQALLTAIPDWSDSGKADKEKQLIAADLKARGFTDADIQSLSNHRTVLLARDAMLYRQQQAAKPATEKQVRAAPKIIKPGASQTGDRNVKTLQNLKTAVIKSSGSKQSVVDYLLATGKA